MTSRCRAARTVVLLLSAIPSAAFGKAFIGVAIGDSGTSSQCDIPVWALSCDSDSNGYEAFGGFQFNDYFALEASYVDFGSFFALPVLAIYFAPEGHATSITAKGILPLGERFALFGKAGMSRWELELGGFDSAFDRAGEGTDETVAVGVDFILDVFAVRAQFARTDFGGVDVEFNSIGFMLRF